MDLNKVVDAVLDGLYHQNKNHICASDLIQQMGLSYDQSNSDIICDKLESLPYYDKIAVASRSGSDLLLSRNGLGFEFIQKYSSYSNYVQVSEDAERQSKRIAEQGSRGSFWSGVGAVLAIPLSIVSLVYTYQKDQKQERNIEILSDSLRTTATKLRAVEKTIQRQMKTSAKMDSLAGSKRK